VKNAQFCREGILSEGGNPIKRSHFSVLVEKWWGQMEISGIKYFGVGVCVHLPEPTNQQCSHTPLSGCCPWLFCSPLFFLHSPTPSWCILKKMPLH
jgi:hypothetical protein